MTDLKKMEIFEDTTIREAIKAIDIGNLQLAIVVDKNRKLLGTLTDGDIRRGILSGLDIDSNIKGIYFRSPLVATLAESKKEIIQKALDRKIHQVPIIDENNHVIDIRQIEELIKPRKKSNKVVLMVGGLGTRLKPLTEKVPKPLLKVGNKTILETILSKLLDYGYKDILMCVNYKSDMIQEFFGDGSKFGVSIEYILEEKRMGTAGALSLLKDKVSEPFFVMNGDLLTDINFENIYNFFVSNEADALMCVREYEFQIPYGVVNTDNIEINSIQEKPSHKFFVNAGIYMLSPEVLKYVPKNEFYNMTTLFEQLIEKHRKVISFPHEGYWMDIGRFEEYEKANTEFNNIL